MPGSGLGRFWPKATDLNAELKEIEGKLRDLEAALDSYGRTVCEPPVSENPAASPGLTGPGPNAEAILAHSEPDPGHDDTDEDEDEDDDHHFSDDGGYDLDGDERAGPARDLGEPLAGNQGDQAGPGSDDPDGVLAAAAAAGEHGLAKRFSSTVACDLVASRVAWKRGPSFDPRPFIHDYELLGGYEDPAVLQLAGRFPDYPAGKIHATKAEFSAFLKKWDDVGSLLLAPASSSTRAFRCGAFGVPKDVESERFIINPMAVNSTMRKVSRCSSSLSPGSLLCGLVLPRGRGLLVNSDDLRDFYHSFVVSPARARRNTFNVTFPAADFADFRAYRAELAGGDVCPCLNTLGMGDSLAVEAAQATHLGLLRSCGAARPEHYVRYGAPFPRGPLYELLAIDDHVMLEEVALPSVVGPGAGGTGRAAPEAFERVSSSYSRRGLVRHDGKAVRGAPHGEVLGAELDGIAGTVGPPRARVVALVALTLRVCRAGRITPAAFSSLLGS